MLLAWTAESEFAHSMTGVVERNLVREGAQFLLYLYNIVQELHYVHRLLGSKTFVGKQTGIVDADEGRTADTGSHHIVETLEQILKLLGQWNGLLLEPSVGHWLAAAGLVIRILHVESQVTQ